MRVINDPEATAKELERVIETDPPLAARVLMRANSAYYAPQQRINNIKQAIIWIGADALKELALSQKVCGLFKKSRPFSGYSREQLWKHSTAVALAAKLIYRREFKEKGENIYAAGLLHDIGFIMQDQFEPDRFTEFLKEAKDPESSLQEAEAHHFGHHHGEIGAALMEAWQLPSDMVTAMKHHHSPMDAPESNNRPAMTLYLADYMTQEAGIGLTGISCDNPHLVDLCLIEQNLERSALEIIMEEVTQDIKEMEAQGLL